MRMERFCGRKPGGKRYGVIFRSEDRDRRRTQAGDHERPPQGTRRPRHQRSLDRDYHVLKYLIEHAADVELVSIENRLLILDYKLMHCWFNLTRTLAPVHSRKALTEMASVLVVLVRKMSQQSGVQSEA